MPGRGAAMDFAGQFAQPAQFGSELLDDKADHPHRLVEAMADLLAYGAQCSLFPLQLSFQKLLTASQLLLEDPGPGLPR